MNIIFAIIFIILILIIIYKAKALIKGGGKTMGLSEPHASDVRSGRKHGKVG